MEEMTEVELDGKKYIWDGDNWCEARTYMMPPDNVLNKLNQTYRPGEAGEPAKAAKVVRAKAPKRASTGFKPKAAIAAPPPVQKKTVERINSFEGENAFLSIDSPATVYLDGQPFPSVALAFESAKQLHDRLRLGMQREWDDIKRVPLMRRLLRSKFSHPQLREALIGTGDKHLSNQAEGADPFWHAPNGEGENTLGKLLMDLRAQLNKSYHLLRDEEIVEHLREYLPDNRLVPDSALVRDDCWKRITELHDLYRDELNPDVYPLLKARREEMLANAKA